MKSFLFAFTGLFFFVAATSFTQTALQQQPKELKDVQVVAIITENADGSVDISEAWYCKHKQFVGKMDVYITNPLSGKVDLVTDFVIAGKGGGIEGPQRYYPAGNDILHIVVTDDADPLRVLHQTIEL